MLIKIMNFKNIIFMSENSTLNNIENDKFNFNINDIDYKNLINRLQEIKTIIALLEKAKFR